MLRGHELEYKLDLAGARGISPLLHNCWTVPVQWSLKGRTAAAAMEVPSCGQLCRALFAIQEAFAECEYMNQPENDCIPASGA